MAFNRLLKALSRSSFQSIKNNEAPSQDDNHNHTPMQPASFEELEEQFLAADFGPRLSQHLVEELKHAKSSSVPSISASSSLLLPWMQDVEKPLILEPDVLNIVLVLGINGSGKTSVCGKLASKFVGEKKKVGLVAADTFRAAAIQQLQHWADQIGCDFFTSKAESDPAATVYRSIEVAKQKNLDVLLIDTAGRLHNKQHLLDELIKIKRVIHKKLPGQPIHAIVVMDAAIGQNALRQIDVFGQALDVNGLIITKLDGSTKGGIVVALAERTSCPIYYLGIGEGIDDLIPYNAVDFLSALFAAKTNSYHNNVK